MPAKATCPKCSRLVYREKPDGYFLRVKWVELEGGRLAARCVCGHDLDLPAEIKTRLGATATPPRGAPMPAGP